MSYRAGHINSCAGIAKSLSDFGNEVIFAIPQPCSWLVEKYVNFLTIQLYPDPEMSKVDDIQTKWGELMQKMAPVFKLNPYDQLEVIETRGHLAFIRFAKLAATVIHDLINSIKPDIIIFDSLMYSPIIANCGLPWIAMYSPNPLRVYRKCGAPPHFAGYAMDESVEQCEKHRKRRIEVLAAIKADYVDWCKEKGFEMDIQQELDSPFLSLYFYPADVDYDELGPVPDKWHRLDHAMRPADEGPLGVDESFFQQKAKFVFFSLGSMGSADVELMRKLIAIFAQSKHKFIVSKGPFHDQIELANNMTGSKYVNQLKLLPLVDLVIHHGGNNTFVESLYFGKPMIVLPLYGDQHDNGRRVMDKKIGKCFYPYHVNGEELIDAVDELLNDVDLKKRVAKIGENMRNSTSHQELNEKMLQIVKEHSTH